VIPAAIIKVPTHGCLVTHKNMKKWCIVIL
jgi:hypothetical protein